MANRFSNKTGMKRLTDWATYLVPLSLMIVLVATSDMKLCTRTMKSHPRIGVISVKLKGLCGSHISEALKMICNGRGFAGKQYKRSVDQDDTDELNSIYPDMNAKDALDVYKQSMGVRIPPDHGPDVDDVMSDLIMKRQSAANFLDKRSAFFTSGVSCECCYNPCAIRELKGYCRA